MTPPHRVKSVSMASFGMDEIDFLRTRGNQVLIYHILNEHLIYFVLHSFVAKCGWLTSLLLIQDLIIKMIRNLKIICLQNMRRKGNQNLNGGLVVKLKCQCFV